MIKKWIFLNSTWKGQLKNVPDGSREIQKPKEATQLATKLFLIRGQFSRRQMSQETTAHNSAISCQI